MDNKELIIKHATVLFTELEDKGYGRNIVIDVTDDKIRSQIEAWAKENGIKPKIKEYTNKEGKTTQQYQLKLSKFIKIAGKEQSFTESSLGYGALINFSAVVYEYDNKFGKGKSASITNIFIIEPMKNTKMAELSE